MNNRDILETWFRRVWLEEDLSAIDDMMAADAPVHGLEKSPHVGPADFKAFAGALLTHITDTSISIDEYMENGNQVSLLMNVSAKCRKTGKPVQMFGLAMCRIVDGKIVQAHNYADFMGLFEQLGVLPADAMQKCLCGEALGTAQK
ncbi:MULTISPECIES: ester cyclase [unclassified Roseovarius]|uniref:ester cyclase n=1 Tax=unclassified Roseovarius TaxID=2614913 RepID=UPI00273D3453|nr:MULTISPECIES: nuclear transport factor 2 family protein [unclassified Roseovarius]